MLQLLCLQVQIDAEEEILKKRHEDIQKLEQSLCAKKSDVCATSDRLKHIRSSMLEGYCPFQNETPTLEFIELQVEVTKYNIEMVDKRSELTLEKIQVKSLKEEIIQRELSLKMKHNLLVSKCRLLGMAG